MEIYFEVTCLETKEQQTFPTLADAEIWKARGRKISSIFGGTCTYTTIKVQRSIESETKDSTECAFIDILQYHMTPGWTPPLPLYQLAKWSNGDRVELERILKRGFSPPEKIIYKEQP
jgi:hypothetical protein